MPCRATILSEDIYDYITDFPIEETTEPDSVICTEKINDIYDIIYVDNAKLPSLENNFFDYQGIPKLYGLMQIDGDAPIISRDGLQPFDPSALIASGIASVQGPPLNLTGFGTIVCFIDTGIDYTNPVFRDELGNTRILAIWDQDDQSGRRPDGFLYGSEYTKEEINQALRSNTPLDIVPSMDENGHGTALASIAAGGSAGTAMGVATPSGAGGVTEDAIVAGSAGNGIGRQNIPVGFRGAAPEAEIVVVKLKKAKRYLRDYYLIPQDAIAYQENDIMLAVKYCDTFVRIFQRPIVICIGLGTSLGDHNGISPLSAYLNSIAQKRNRAVVVCGGNEGNSAGHYRGEFRAVSDGFGIVTTPSQQISQSVEIRVADGNRGFFMELWGRGTNVINVGIRSPGGEVIPPIPIGLRQSITFGFVYERTQITIYSTLVESTSGEELIYFRLVDPTPGIWTIRVIGQVAQLGGVFDLWLPLTQFQSAPVYFLSPDPSVTLTEPAMAGSVIAVSAYQASNASFYIESGRGFSRAGLPRPDLAAPGVDVTTVYGKQSGTGFAAALTSGAVALLLQWAVVDRNNIFTDSRVIKGYLIRGAKRETDIVYPNEEWGYGRLNLEGVFNSLIST